jgi:Zinc carboxypeptidase/Cytosolic carboxypeptidase N-terminal domain
MKPRLALIRISILLVSWALLPPLAWAAGSVYFNSAFESGLIGQIDPLGENEFRLHVIGQQDSRGHNRQATWHYFRMENVAGRELTLHFTDFLGEYNDIPDKRAPVGASYRPWFSEDNVHWQHVDELAWDATKDEATIKLHPQGNTLWVAHVPPYPHSRLLRLLDEIGGFPDARVEVIGRSARGRDLHLVTITNSAQPDGAKKTVWFIARQHPWETGTSYVIEGALRFLVSDDPGARRLRDTTIFKLMPMMNPDGAALGFARFNANGYDTNRQWDIVDLRDKQWLEKMPEIWYVKTAILSQHARHPIDLVFNLHNDESNEYMETMVDAAPQVAMLDRLFAALADKTLFDPSRPKLSHVTTGPANTTLSLWTEARVPTIMMERRIVASKKVGRLSTPDDNLQFGRELAAALAEAVQQP